MSDAARRLGVEVAVFVKVDTGLGSVGVRHGKAVDLIEHVSGLRGVSVAGAFSTFNKDRELDRVQLERMVGLLRELKRRRVVIPTWIMASSNAVFHLQKSYLSAVGPVLML